MYSIYLHNLSGPFVVYQQHTQHINNVCISFTSNIHNISLASVFHLPATCTTYHWRLYSIYQQHTQHIIGVCIPFTSNMHNISPVSVFRLPAIYTTKMQRLYFIYIYQQHIQHTISVCISFTSNIHNKDAASLFHLHSTRTTEHLSFTTVTSNINKTATIFRFISNINITSSAPALSLLPTYKKHLVYKQHKLNIHVF